MNDTEWMEEIIKYQSQLRIIDEEMQLLNKMLETAEGSLQEAWKGSNADLALDKLLQIKSHRAGGWTVEGDFAGADYRIVYVILFQGIYINKLQHHKT